MKIKTVKQKIKNIRIFDTTLRDGEQDSRAIPNGHEKISAARVIDGIGVDVIEAGCLAANCSPDEFSAVREIAQLKRSGELHAEVCALARAKTDDIDTVERAGVSYVHIYMGTSDKHMSSKFRGITRATVIGSSVTAVRHAKAKGMKVLFSAEDATRTETDFLKEVYREVVAAGADEINVPDTLGVCESDNMRRIISEVKSAIGVHVPVHVHCHNDYGIATANTMSAILAGADCAQVTVCGIGERSGNASLEQIVSLLHFNSRYGAYTTNVNPQLLTDAARKIARLFHFNLSDDAPIVGKNAFTHKAGVHEDAVFRDPENYKFINPGYVGNERRIIISKMSSARAINAIFNVRHINLNQTESDAVISMVRSLNGRQISETELAEFASQLRHCARAEDGL